jgi:hypothetical protein
LPLLANPTHFRQHHCDRIKETPNNSLIAKPQSGKSKNYVEKDAKNGI